MSRCVTPSVTPLTTATLLFVATFTIMVGSVITPALPAISSHLGFAHNGGWLVTLPSLGVVVSGRAVGRWIDRSGARLVMLIGLAAYGVLGAIGATLAFSRVFLVADRLLLGAATAMVMAAGSSVISHLYDGQKRLAMIGRQAQAIELGGVVFLSIGGVLGSHGWQLPFGLYLLALAGIPLVLRSIPDLQPASTSRVEAHLPPQLRSILLAATLNMMFFFVSFLTLPNVLAQRLHYTEAQTGYFLASISAVAVLVAGVLPRLARFLSAGWLICIGFALFGSGLILFSQGTTPTTFACGAVASGCAFGISIPLVNHLTVEKSPAAVRGLSLGLLSSALFLGQFLSSAVTLFGRHQQTAMLLAGFLSMVVALLWRLG